MTKGLRVACADPCLQPREPKAWAMSGGSLWCWSSAEGGGCELSWVKEGNLGRLCGMYLGQMVGAGGWAERLAHSVVGRNSMW